jgi:tRNA (cmo5U34)-methyltransferase
MAVNNQDDVYAEPVGQLQAFEFNAQVADVFENMIERSVPGYALILDLIGVATEHYAIPNTNCYDLGCSLGASTLRIRQHLPASCHVIGVDSSADMVQRCRTNVELDHSQASVEIRQQDIRETTFDNASLVVMNFTLQFIADEDREPLLQRIAAGMVDGGVLILCEKICFEDPQQQSFIDDLHLAFKRYRGYSNLEISQKRAALENVLVPNSLATHRQRLQRAGFSQVDQIVQSLNFVTLLARKSDPTKGP